MLLEIMTLQIFFLYYLEIYHNFLGKIVEEFPVDYSTVLNSELSFF